MPNAGFAGIGESGVLIDLGRLNQIQVSEDRNAVSVGSAATWGNLYTELEKYDRTAVGGRNLDVGIAGLVLGGKIFLHLYRENSISAG